MNRLNFWIALLCSVSGTATATPLVLQSDFGGVGLMQTPSARMESEGMLSLNYSRVEPYTRIALSAQPFEWFEGVFRYTDTSTIRYQADPSGKQSTKDKGFDLKIRLLKESSLRPEVSVGLRDIGGTSLFSGEYLVANKRWRDFDLSLGYAWGYLGKRGDIENPLGSLYDGFKVRPRGTTAQGGMVAFGSFFRGPGALFGGIQWQTPIEKLQLKLEYEGNNYKNDFGGPTVKQDSPINYGATYRVSDNLSVSASWERGNTAMLGLTLQADLGEKHVSPRKISDPPAEAIRQDDLRPNVTADWDEVSKRLEKSAGFQVERITTRKKEIVVTGQQNRYFYAPTGLGRVARVLDNVAAPEVDWITVVEKKDGMPIVETSINRALARASLQEELPLEASRATVEHTEPLQLRQETLLHTPPAREPFTWETALGYGQSIGGPNAPILFQFNANLIATYRFNSGTTLDSLFSFNFYNNYDNFTYTAASNLPRVRTYIREYLVTSEVTMPRFQLTHAQRIQPDWYAMAYGGYLETMYAGVGGEVLYRPLNSPLAVGFNLNWVKQRDFAQDFALRDYSVLTGHLSAYYRNLLPGMLLTTSFGRYLAGDIGVTVDLAREFSNGVRMGAWFTLTNVSARQFGEGSFDKGFYVTFPFDLLSPRSTQERANMVFQPLTRDGGARLSRYKTLYDLTEGRNLDFFHQNFQKIRD